MVVWTKETNGLTRALERTATPLRSSRVAGFDGAFWWSEVTGVITAGRLSLSSVVDMALICQAYSSSALRKFSFFLPAPLHHLLDRVRDRNTFPAVINAEIRESTRGVRTSRSYQQNTVRRGVWSWARHEDRIFLTASNDHQAFRLTGSLPLARSRRAGVRFHFSFF